MHKVLLLVLCCLLPVPALAQGTSDSRILVMPFDNPGREPRLHWIAEAASLLIADELNARGVAAIRRAERVRAFEQLHLPNTATLSRATVVKVGELVAASEVIVGSVRLQNEHLTIEAHSIRIDIGRLQPHVVERGPLGEVVSLFERLGAKLAGGGSRPDRAARPPLDAFEAYVKGLMAERAATRATFLESAIRLHPGYDRAQLALWHVRRDQADHAAALAAAAGVPESSPFARRARFFAAISLLELKRFDEALDGFAATIEGAPAPVVAAAFNNMGVVQLRRLGNVARGHSTYFLTKAADADPGDADILFNLGYAYVLERNYQGAIYWLREGVRRDPGDAEAHYLLSVALQGVGSSVEAAREQELARQLSSKIPEFDKQAAEERGPAPRGLERIRDDPESRINVRPEQTIVSSAQREQRELAVFHLERGRRLVQREEDREALTELRRAVYLSPYEAEAHLLIGRIHLRAGRPADAVEALKISIWSADTAAARVALAEAYVKQQNMSAARTELERALVLDPESVAAKRLLSEVSGK